MSNNNKVYLIAMIESLINEKEKTDLGTHYLEYKYGFAEINLRDIFNGDLCLAVLVRLVNKDTKKVEWGNVYYKTLYKDVSIYEVKNIKKRLEEIKKSSVTEKINFITNQETSILKKYYRKEKCIDPRLCLYFKDLNFYSKYDFHPMIDLDGVFPKEVISSVNKKFEEIMVDMKNNDMIIGNKKTKILKK